MTRNRSAHGEYIYQVRENTREYIESLRAQVEKLKGQLASLEVERSVLEGKLHSAANEINLLKGENNRLIHRFDELENERERTIEYHTMIEQQNNALANLYVAAYGLHGTLNREEVIAAIKEIVTNLVGSEEIAIFETCASRKELSLVASIGIDAHDFRTIEIGRGLIGNAVQSGNQYILGDECTAEPAPCETDLTACIPLRVGENIEGAIAIFNLLQQKPMLQSLDFEIFDLLASQAGIALHGAKLQSMLEAQGNRHDRDVAQREMS